MIMMMVPCKMKFLFYLPPPPALLARLSFNFNLNSTQHTHFKALGKTNKMHSAVCHKNKAINYHRLLISKFK